jgi:hypothetical protein
VNLARRPCALLVVVGLLAGAVSGCGSGGDGVGTTSGTGNAGGGGGTGTSPLDASLQGTWYYNSGSRTYMFDQLTFTSWTTGNPEGNLVITSDGVTTPYLYVVGTDGTSFMLLRDLGGGAGQLVRTYGFTVSGDVLQLTLWNLTGFYCRGAPTACTPGPALHHISGVVSGAVAEGVTITLGGGATATTTTTAEGTYALNGLVAGTYTVTPSRAGFTFTPASRQVVLGNSDANAVDFTATAAPATHSISGTISGVVADGVLVTLAGAASRSATTAGGGRYSFTGLPDGTYSVTPSLAGFAFTPSTTQVVLHGADVAATNFTAASATPPVNVTAPAITGTASPCARLTASDGTWSGAGSISTTRRWRRCDAAGSGCADIPGATSATYTVASADVGSTLRVAVTAAAGGGSTAAESAPTAVVQAALSVTDGEFTSWLSFSFVTDDPYSPAAGPGTSSGSVSRSASGGHPGAWLAVTHSFTSGDTIWTGGVKSDLSHDPATGGAFATVSVTADVAMLSSGASAWQVVVDQGGRRYYSFPFGTFSGTWATVSAACLTAADFDTNPWAGNAGVAPDGNRPDFSSAGAPLRFGILVGNRLDGPGTATASHGVDNFALTLGN